MAATTTHGASMAALRRCVPPKGLGVKLGLSFVGVDVKEASWTSLKSSTCISSRKSLLPRSSVCNRCSGRGVTRAMSAADAKPTLPVESAAALHRQRLQQSLTNPPLRRQFHSQLALQVVSLLHPVSISGHPSFVSSTHQPGLPVDLQGKRAFIAGVADDNRYGWAIAKSLAAAGAEILVGTWVPALNIFETSLRRGKFDETCVLPDGSLMEISKIYPLDAVFDNPVIPEDIKTNKLYSGSSKWTVQEVAESLKEDFGTIDILVHSQTDRRNGYLAAVSASSYSFVSLLKHFLPIMNPVGATISLTYFASEKIIPGYGGGMSSAKAALEIDTRVLAFEAGRKHNIRVNTISAGPLRSHAAKAIGLITRWRMRHCRKNFPQEVGNAAAFLCSPLALAITGSVIYVDNRLNAMGRGMDSPILAGLDIPKQK